MFLDYRKLRKYIGFHVQCHTHYGTYQGVIVHCTKRHVILAPIQHVSAHGRYYPMGHGPMGPGGPGGPGPGWGGGWGLAIPLAAILGITAIGMHW